MGIFDREASDSRSMQTCFYEKMGFFPFLI